MIFLFITLMTIITIVILVKSKEIYFVSVSFKRNKSFLFITHDMNDVLEYAEEVIVMDKGKLLYHTSPSELFEKYSDKLESLGLELPECISFLNKLNQKLKVPIKIDRDIKEENILLSIKEKLMAVKQLS